MKRSLLGGISMLTAAAAMMGQTPKPVPTTTITSSSPTLQLPGSLTLTTTVAPPAATGGMPTGKVAFLNGSASLGTGTLAMIPSTQSFSAKPTIQPNVALSPFGLFTLPSATPPYSVLGMLAWLRFGELFIAYEPQVTIFSGQGTSLFQTPNPTPIPNTGFSYNASTQQGSIDAYAIGDFNQDGLPDVLLHGIAVNPSKDLSYNNQYYLVPGKPGGGFDPTKGVPSPYGTPIATPPNTRLLIFPDDFNGDGFSDVAYAIFGGTNTIGVALNAGAGAPGNFPSVGFHSAPAVADAAGDPLYPTALASGHFTSSGHADLVVAGVLSTRTGPTSAVAFLPGNGDGTFGTAAVFSGTAETAPIAVATADLRGNGMTDVVLGEDFIGRIGANPGYVQVFRGNGQGGLTASSLVTLLAAPSSLTIRDCNNDGYPDIVVTGTDGSLNLILNDGTGLFSTATPIGTTPTPPTPQQTLTSLTTSGDFNGDGLADIAEITTLTGSDTPTSSTASELLNSASSQAVVNTPPQTLPAGTDTLTASFPSDNNFAASTSAGVPITVTQTPSTITWAAPPAVVSGTGLSGAQLNASANVPGSFTYRPAVGTVLPVGQTIVTAVFAPADSFDYSGSVATQTITVLPGLPTATATAPATTATKKSDSASLTVVNPYTIPITATVTLSFTPTPPNTFSDPMVLFPNNKPTEVLLPFAASSTMKQSIDFNSGSTAGTITLTIELTAGEANVTPKTLAPLKISVPASPPVIESVTLTRSGHTMTAVIRGLSSPRDMARAHFHFTPAPGKELKTTDLTVNSPFGTWYESSIYGTAFTYTQPFMLNSDAATVGSVAVTLTNSKGDSQPSTAH